MGDTATDANVYYDPQAHLILGMHSVITSVRRSFSGSVESTHGKRSVRESDCLVKKGVERRGLSASQPVFRLENKLHSQLNLSR